MVFKIGEYHHTEEAKRKMKEARKNRIISEETKAKISKSNKGHQVSLETKNKMRLSKIGNKIWLGRHHKEETKNKLRIVNIGKHHSEETKQKIKENNPYEKRKKRTLDYITEDYRKKMSLAKKGKKNTWGAKISKSSKGKIASGETRKKMSLALKGLMALDKNPNWRGGKSFEPYSVDWTINLRKAIRERDRYTCQICFKEGFNVHHIDYNKKNCNSNNLVTLCKSCHTKTSNSNRNKWIEYFRELEKRLK